MKTVNRTVNLTDTITHSTDHEYDQDNYYNDTSGLVIDMEKRAREMFSEPSDLMAIVLSLTAVILNTLTLTALSKTRGRLITHFRFMISLAISDIMIGCTVLLHVLNKTFNPTIYYPGIGPEDKRLSSMCAFLIIKSFFNVGLNIGLLNLMGMAIDHFIAIKYPLHYNQMLNKKRSTLLIIGLWIIAFFCGFSDFFTGVRFYNKLKHKYNFCEIVHITKYADEYTIFGTTSITGCVMIYVYTKIFIQVHSHRIPGEQTYAMSSYKQSEDSECGAGGQCSSNKTSSFQRRVRRSNRALKTTLLIVLTFVVCWLPLCIFQVSLILIINYNLYKDKLEDPKIQTILILTDRYLVDILVINSILNPIIYTVRLDEVQLGYRRMFNSITTCLKLPCFLRVRGHQSSSFYNRDRSNTFFNRADIDTTASNRPGNLKNIIYTSTKVASKRERSSFECSHGNSSQANSSSNHSHSSHSRSNHSSYNRPSQNNKKVCRKTSQKSLDELYY